MAGCPKPPTASEPQKPKEAPSQPTRVYKQPGSGRRIKADAIVKRNTFEVDTTSAVAVLIQHFLLASEELHRIAGAEKKESSFDLLRLAFDASLHASSPSCEGNSNGCSEGFVDFITRVNNE